MIANNKIRTAIMEKRLFRTTYKYILKRIIGKSYVITKYMNYLPDDARVSKTYSYVRIGSLELNAIEIYKNDIKGDVAELGVYRGEFAKEINRVFPDRNLFLFDTFEGFDNRDVGVEKKYGYSKGDQDFSETSVERVLSLMPHKEKCIVRKGWFPDTTKGLEKLRFAFVSIDADLFDPIYLGMKWFYPRLVEGGMIFVHDFNNCEYKGAAEAVRRYCRENEVSYFCIPDECGTAVIIK